MYCYRVYNICLLFIGNISNLRVSGGPGPGVDGYNDTTPLQGFCLTGLDADFGYRSLCRDEEMTPGLKYQCTWLRI